MGITSFKTFVGRWERVARDPMPVGLPVASYTGDEYGTIVYGRGPIFVRRWRDTMGRDVFDDFLRDYIRQFRWEEAPADFPRAGQRRIAGATCPRCLRRGCCPRNQVLRHGF